MLWEEETPESSDADIPTKIAILENDIVKGDYDLANEIHIYIPESEKTEYGNEWRTYREQNSNL